MENLKITLCIPTIDRFDTFLDSYIQNYLIYLKNGLINELIINDENGNDYNKITNKYDNELNNEFKIYKNENILGPFLNKLKVCNYSSNEYIVLMDSDNFADENYFITLRNYIHKNIDSFSKNFVLSPSFAKPNFNYKHFENHIITKQNLNEYKNLHNFACMLNTGNYFLTKSCINNIIPNPEIVNFSHSADVIYYNTLCFQQIEDFQFHVIENLEYLHVVHDGSVYINSSKDDNIRKYADTIHQIFFNL